ncbi:unnamed protein product, partial [Rotaria magnacalcarata]
SSTSNSESINAKLEQNRVEQLRLIDDMKEMVLKTCVPALDHVRKQAATTTGNAQQQVMIATSGGTTPAPAGTTLAGANQNVNPMQQLSVRF